MALSQLSVRAADSSAVAGCLMRVESPLGGAGGLCSTSEDNSCLTSRWHLF